MIGFIQGKVISSDGVKIVVLTQSGIGYEINYGYLAKLDDQIGLHIHHHITDNDQSLWGFNSLEDKKVFELLKTVNKVGSSKAYPLITNLTSQGVIDAIVHEQQGLLTSVKGIGKKMSEQIILSLKDKVKKFGVTSNEMSPEGSEEVETLQSPKAAAQIDKRLLQETLQALESLGYKDKNIMPLIQSTYNESITTSEELLKQLLKEL